MQVQLTRNTMEPWGFRLQGGRDFRDVLSVKKVTPNTPAAQAGLHAGMQILAIGGYDAQQMTHAQASDVIKNSGGYLQMTLGQSASVASLKPTGPVKFNVARATHNPVQPVHNVQTPKYYR